MNRIRILTVMILAVTVGGGLAYTTYSYIQNAPVKTVSIPTQPVIVAATDLELGTELRPEDVKAVDWPASAVPKDTFRNKSDVAGRGLIVPVIANELILPMKLASKEAGAGIPTIIPPGLRAMSIRVNEVIGVAGYVLPGNRVDVIATASPNENRGDMTSKVVLTNMQVLTAGTKIEQNGANGQPQPVTVVTLLVTPEEAERLTLASTEGKIQLALRNPLDQLSPVTPGVRPAALLGTTPKTTAVRVAMSRRPVASASVPAMPVAAAAPDALPTIEIIRGDKRVYEVVR